MSDRLSIELVPRGAWFKNLRTMLQKSQWDALRMATYRRVNYRCEICGGKGQAHPVECHEKWEYDDEKHTATLVGLLALCPACHECKHVGLAQVKGRLPQVIEHLAWVNEISAGAAHRMVDQAFNVWSARSEYEWTVNIDWARGEGGAG